MTIDDKLKASRDAALQALNRTESWWKRCWRCKDQWLGWAIGGVIAAAIVILCRSCA